MNLTNIYFYLIFLLLLNSQDIFASIEKKYLFSNISNSTFKEIPQNSYIIGKVFIDLNANQIQDNNETGVENVKIYLETGTFALTDNQGKYHFKALKPGSHSLKIDPASIPKNLTPIKVNNRFIKHNESQFADTFSEDLFRADFSLVPKNKNFSFNKKEEIKSIQTKTSKKPAAKIEYALSYKKPIADGRTPLFLTIMLKDEDTITTTKDITLQITGNRGEVWDEKIEKYISLKNKIIKRKTKNGKLTLKLSPALSSESRKITIKYKNIKRYANIQFYPEIRPLIINGVAETGVDFAKKSDNAVPQNINEPFENKISFYTKGVLFDQYIFTAHYDSAKADSAEDSFTEESSSSNDEGEYCTIYADNSREYHETKSRDNLFFKLEKDLSYIMHGDFTTNFGEGLEYNIYHRTLNGKFIRIKEKDNYNIKLFHAHTQQDLIQKEFAGKGVSGPYFFDSALIEHSETIYLTIKDRYNAEQTIEKIALERYEDYIINYEEGWIIFNESIPEFDDDFNPVFISAIYEGTNFKDKKHIYGIRIEKDLTNDIQIGASAVKENHMIADRYIKGADLVYDNQKDLTATLEFADTKGFDENTFETLKGTAKKAEVIYQPKDSYLHLFYNEVDDNYQNPSSTTIKQDSIKYGINAKKKLNAKNILNLKTYRNKTVSTKYDIYEVSNDYKINKKFTLTTGAKHIDEKTTVNTSSSQAILGLTYKPTKKLDLSINHAQTLNSEKSSLYPTKTAGRIKYRLSKKNSAEISYEKQDRIDKTVSLFSFGLNSKLSKNTTAFSKYLVDDSTDNFHSQSHTGITHNWLLSKQLKFNLALKGVKTLKGSGSKDYNSISLGADYTKNRHIKTNFKYEHRFNKQNKDQKLIQISTALKATDEYTLYFKERYFKSLYDQNNLLFELAYRPIHNKINYFLKVRHLRKKSDTADNTKLIGSCYVNYKPIKDITILSSFTLKKEKDNAKESYTKFLKARALWDIVPNKIDAGFHAGVLTQYDNKKTIIWGPEIGYSMYKNLWISAGYNFNGFYDDDLEEETSWKKGAYLKLRWKFDENGV